MRVIFHLSVKPGPGCLHCFSESTILAKLRPCVFLCTEGDNNTPPNPPLSALLTQSIPHGVGRGQVAVAKLWLPWQQGLWVCCDVSQVRSGGLGSNKADPCWG